MSKSPPSVDELIDLVHQYYPAGIDNDDAAYETSPETRRLRGLLEPLRRELEAGRKDPGWARFMMAVREEFADCMIQDTTPPLSEPCFCCRVFLPWVVTGSETAESVVVLWSLLAPVYAIYASRYSSRDDDHDQWVKLPPLPAEFQSHEDRLAAILEREHALTRLPSEALFTPVPDVVPWSATFPLGQARLIDCLFTVHRW